MSKCKNINRGGHVTAPAAVNRLIVVDSLRCPEPELGFPGRGTEGARGQGTGKGEEDGGGARARGRRMGAGVTAEELGGGDGGGGDGGGGPIFRQPFGSNSGAARRNKKIWASSGTYIATD